MCALHLIFDFGTLFSCRLLYEKPAFKKLYAEKSENMDTNAVNVIIEYVTDKKK